MIARFGGLMKFRVVIAAVAMLAVTACSTNQTTGRQSFTAFMSEESEGKIGAENHPKILQQFGGEYKNPKLQAYVNRIGADLAKVTEKPGLRFRFTILNTPQVNAFALPGGYVYITRGLLALADNEAQVAGVLGHEMGHVLARHGAERYSTQLATQIGAGLLGVLSRNRDVAKLAGVGANLFVKSYSRDQEFEADTLGHRYISKAGFHPSGVADFLRKLRDHSKLTSDLSGLGRDPDEVNLLATHPRTIERVQEAERAIGGGARDGRVGEVAYKELIDGLLFGDDPEEGFVRGRLFQHPVLRFQFEVPPGFNLSNGRTQVQARGPNNSAVIFTIRPIPPGVSEARFLRYQFAKGISVRNVENINVNGLRGATGSARLVSRGQAIDVRPVVLPAPNRSVYQLVFISRAQDTRRLAEDFRRTTYSFKRLNDQEAQELKPFRLKIHRVQAGDTVARLAQWMPKGPDPIRRFRVLNGLERNQTLKPGQLVKYVTF